MSIRILPNYHVGAYRIRPENICVDKLTHSGVCDTPGRIAYALKTSAWIS